MKKTDNKNVFIDGLDSVELVESGESKFSKAVKNTMKLGLKGFMLTAYGSMSLFIAATALNTVKLYDDYNNVTEEINEIVKNYQSQRESMGIDGVEYSERSILAYRKTPTLLDRIGEYSGIIGLTVKINYGESAGSRLSYYAPTKKEERRRVLNGTLNIDISQLNSIYQDFYHNDNYTEEEANYIYDNLELFIFVHEYMHSFYNGLYESEEHNSLGFHNDEMRDTISNITGEMGSDFWGLIYVYKKMQEDGNPEMFDKFMGSTKRFRGVGHVDLSKIGHKTDIAVLLADSFAKSGMASGLDFSIDNFKIFENFMSNLIEKKYVPREKITIPIIGLDDLKTSEKDFLLGIVKNIEVHRANGVSSKILKEDPYFFANLIFFMGIDTINVEYLKDKIESGELTTNTFDQILKESQKVDNLNDIPKKILKSNDLKSLNFSIIALSENIDECFKYLIDSGITLNGRPAYEVASYDENSSNKYRVSLN